MVAFLAHIQHNQVMCIQLKILRASNPIVISSPPTAEKRGTTTTKQKKKKEKKEVAPPMIEF